MIVKHRLLFFRLLLLFVAVFFLYGSCTSSSEAEQMEYIWQVAQEHRQQNISMSEDTLLPRALRYFRELRDSAKLLDGYLLEAIWSKWHDKQQEAEVAVNNGLHHAQEMEDTLHVLLFRTAQYELLYKQHRYREAIDAAEYAMMYGGDRLNEREQYVWLYRTALCLSLLGDPAYDERYRQCIDKAMAACDTVSAVHFMRNLADVYANNRKYAQSNELIYRILHLMPELEQYSALQATLTQNFLNLHRKDSARYYYGIALAHEQRLQASGQRNSAISSALLLYKSLLDYADGIHVTSTELGRFNDSIRHEVEDKQNTIRQQLETRNKLQQMNYELRISRQYARLRLLLSGVLFVGCALVVWFYIRNRYKRLAEAEERIDTLTRMLAEAQKTATIHASVSEDDGAFFKKLLLQQLGIIRLVANTPTTQNQELLRRISGISNKEIPVDSLLNWDDLYPLIDKLYDNFHIRLVERFPTLSAKEVQICCLLRANFSTKEIGVITQQSSATIYVRKSAIRKKIGAGEGEDIIGYLR